MVSLAGETRILLDTNALIDFIVGATAVFQKDTMSFFEKTVNLLYNDGAVLALSEKGLHELGKVLGKSNIRKILQTYTISPEEVMEFVTGHEGSGIEIVSIDKDKERKVIEKYTKVAESRHIKFPTEDAHVLAALIKYRPKFFVSRDEKVYKTAELISNIEGLGVAVKSFKGFIDSLVALHVINAGERYIIGYKAYELQILPFTHMKAFDCGSVSDWDSLGSWIKYSQEMLNGYIPAKYPQK